MKKCCIVEREAYIQTIINQKRHKFGAKLFEFCICPLVSYGHGYLYWKTNSGTLVLTF